MAAVDVTTSGRPECQVLAWSRLLFLPALRDAIESLPDSVRHIAGYHLGWWDAAGNPVEADGGKAIRRALAVVCAEAVGGSGQDAVPAAVAVELVHNFSLIHDDVMDGDDMRRHRPTAWREFGVANAILAGDALMALAYRVLVDAQEGSIEESTRTLSATVQALVDGQHSDLAFEARQDVALDECVRMSEQKTGALLSGACTLGAMAGRGSVEQVEHLGHFGALLGLAFQVVDDLHGIWGDPAATGKPAHSDLRNHKKSLPIVAALSSGTAAGEELAGWFGARPTPAGTDFYRLAELVVESGGRDWCHRKLDTLQAEAIHHLDAARPTVRGSAELLALASLVVGRRPAESGPGRLPTPDGHDAGSPMTERLGARP